MNGSFNVCVCVTRLTWGRCSCQRHRRARVAPVTASGRTTGHRPCVCYALYLQRCTQEAHRHAPTLTQGRVPDALRFGSALHEGQDRHCYGHTGVTHRSIRNGFIAQIHVRFAAASRLSRAVSRCLAAVSRLSLAVSRLAPSVRQLSRACLSLSHSCESVQ